jgi:hypothetical protein
MGVCEGCGQKPATDYAHRVGRGQLGKWSPANALHLCGPGNYGGCHSTLPAAAKALGWRVLSTQDPLLIPAFIWPDPFGPSWAFVTVDGGYDHEHALDAALALGFPEVPDYRRTA